MYSKRKVAQLSDAELGSLVAEVETLELPVAIEAAVLKDLHLVETAMAADHAIVSIDEKVRGLLGRMAPKVPALRNLVWVNPVPAEEDGLSWLRAGARLEQPRRLGSG
ncbi:MAG: hypothetical protein HYV63_12525 [Candidatus Schekmanbacteria bacterium]|nr:hypothetical protein [Candidatus Schekmanbacteria bacterium]